MESDTYGFFGMVCKWGRLFFIHPLQTTLPLEYGALAGFCPAVVLLVEAERAVAFAGKTRGGVGQPKHPVQMQVFSCDSRALAFLPLGFVSLSAISGWRRVLLN